MKADLAIAFVAIGVTAFAVRPAEEPRATKLVDTVHHYYIGQFENLEMIAGGTFGTSRIETSSIAQHTRSGGDPGYRSKEFSNSVTIYGARGKPLTTKNLEFRYHRSSNGVPQGLRLKASQGSTSFDMGQFASDAVRQWSKGDFRPVLKNAGPVHFEARPVRLTKRECLSCHTKLKQNDPVAVMVYRLEPFAKIKG